MTTQTYDQLITIFETVQQVTGGVFNQVDNLEVLSSLGNNPIILEGMKQIIIKIIMVFAVTATVFSIFQGMSWYFAHKSIKKTEFKKYYSQFALQTIGIFSILFLIAVAMVKILFSLSFSLSPIISANTALIIFDFLIALIWFIGIISFTQKSTAWKNVKLSAELTTKKIRKIIIPVLLIIFIFLLLNYVVSPALFSINQALGVITGILLLFPFFAFSRLMLIKAAN